MTSGGRGWRWLGRCSYRDGLAEQAALRQRLVDGDSDAACVLLLEHTPVITLGRNANRSHVLASTDECQRRGIEVLETSRGGDVTYHGPGQLMIYPVVRLRRGVVAYLATIAAQLSAVSEQLGVKGAVWRRNPAGLWVGNNKLAACGIHVRRGVAIHGFAFDVATPTQAWQMIIPCGLASSGNTSIDSERRLRGLGGAPSVEEVASLVGPRLADALGVTVSR